MIGNFIRSIDMKGKDFQFQIDGGSYKTKVGGFLTIVYGLVFFSLLIWYGRDIILRQQPALLTTNTMFDYFPQTPLFNSNFTFALRVEDYYGNLINDPSMFYYEFRNEYYTSRNGVWYKKTEIARNLEICSIKHVDNNTLTTFNLQNYMCTDSNFTIGGDWGSSFMNSPTFFIRRCNAEAESKFNIKCKTDDELFALYENLFINTFTQVNLVNPGDYNNPVSKTMVYSFQGLNWESAKSIKKRIIYRKADVNSDIGFLFSQENKISFIEYQATETDLSPWEKAIGPYVASVTFQLSRNFRSYERVYRKISDALADVGGITSLIFGVLDFLFNFYLELSYWNFLQIKLFKLYREVNKEKSFSSSRKDLTSSVLAKSRDFSDDSSNVVINMSHKSDVERKRKSLKKLVSFSKKTKCLNKDILVLNLNRNLEEFKISVCFRFKSIYFCSKSKKEDKSMNETELKTKMMKACEVELNKKTDIFNLLKTLDQFKLVKKTLFNENQNFMLSKMDLINIVDTDTKIGLELSNINQNKSQIKSSNLVRYLKEKFERKCLTSVDKLLLNNLESEFRNAITKEIVPIN